MESTSPNKIPLNTEESIHKDHHHHHQSIESEDPITKHSTKDFVCVQESPLDLQKLCDMVSAPEAGAVSSFSGNTRNTFEGKKVIRLEYEAYVPMAEKEMLKICDKIRSKWDIISVAIFHRIGVVPIGESSVIIVVSSAHRRESLEAVQFGIDELKATVPIWKKEVYDDNTHAWKENKECCFHP